MEHDPPQERKTGFLSSRSSDILEGSRASAPASELAKISRNKANNIKSCREATIAYGRLEAEGSLPSRLALCKPFQQSAASRAQRRLKVYTQIKVPRPSCNENHRPGSEMTQ